MLTETEVAIKYSRLVKQIHEIENVRTVELLEKPLGLSRSKTSRLLRNRVGRLTPHLMDGIDGIASNLYGLSKERIAKMVRADRPFEPHLVTDLVYGTVLCERGANCFTALMPRQNGSCRFRESCRCGTRPTR